VDKELSLALFTKHTVNLTNRLAATRGWILHKVEYPVIDCEFTQQGRVPLRVRFHCDNWNELPPSIVLLSSEGRELAGPEAPRNHTNVFNASPHPITQKPFICMRGSREYHTHSSHTSDHWENIKTLPSYQLGEILTQVWNAWKKG